MGGLPSNIVAQKYGVTPEAVRKAKERLYKRARANTAAKTLATVTPVTLVTRGQPPPLNVRARLIDLVAEYDGLTSKFRANPDDTPKLLALFRELRETMSEIVKLDAIERDLLGVEPPRDWTSEVPAWMETWLVDLDPETRAKVLTAITAHPPPEVKEP